MAFEEQFNSHTFCWETLKNIDKEETQGAEFGVLKTIPWALVDIEVRALTSAAPVRLNYRSASWQLMPAYSCLCMQVIALETKLAGLTMPGTKEDIIRYLEAGNTILGSHLYKNLSFCRDKKSGKEIIEITCTRWCCWTGSAEPDPLVINGAGNRGLTGGHRGGVASWHPLVISRRYPRFSSSRRQEPV